MTATLNLIVGTIADDVAGASENLDQDRDRIGFGVRLDCPDHIASQTIIGVLAHLGPSLGEARIMRILRLPQLRQWVRCDAIRSLKSIAALDICSVPIMHGATSREPQYAPLYQ